MYGMESTYDEIMDVLDKNQTSAPSIGSTLPSGIYENSDINLMLKSLFSDEVKAKITIDDIRLRSNLNTNKTKSFTKK